MSALRSAYASALGVCGLCAALAAGCGHSSPSTASAADAGGKDAIAETPGGHTARGRVVDLSGAPVFDLYVTVSTEFCIPDRTAADGTFAVRNVGPGGNKRLILYGPTAKAGPYASLSFALTGADDADLDLTKPIVTPRLDAPLAYRPDVVEPQRLATADGFAITIRAADLKIEGFGEPKLYAVSIPREKAPPFGPIVDRLHALYVLEPLQSTLAKPAPIELPNPQALAVGAKVDIVALDYWKGALVPRAKGHVRADGKVVSDDGEGITELTWVGFAPAAP